jgi:hypothetical protein
MNENLKEKLFKILEEESKDIRKSKEDIKIKVARANEVINLVKILFNYEELEPILSKYFKEKAEKEKWSDEK